MITTSEEYQKYLGLITNQNNPIDIIPLPENEKIYHIDLNSRTIEAPKNIGVENDHYAEILHFSVDRYYDNMDLYETVCFVKYNNINDKEDKGRLFYVPFMDKNYLREENKLVFPWCVSGYATKKAGPLEFSFQFYAVDKDEETDSYHYSFILNTQSAKTMVIEGMDIDLSQNENYIFNQDEIANIYAAIDALKREDIYWIQY